MKFDQPDVGYERMLRDLASVRNDGNGATFMSSSDPRVVELLGATPASAGVYVTAESAMRVSAVYACVNRIAGGISTLPCNVYERVWDAGRRRYVRRELEDAPLWWLLNEQPTSAWTGASHWERLIEHRLLRGDHFSEIKRSPSGAIRELVPHPWSAVVPKRREEKSDSRLMYAVTDGMNTRGVDQDDMLHFPGFGFNGIRGLSVISHAARNAAGNAMAMDEYSGRFFAGGAHPSIVLTSKKKMDQEMKDDLRKQFADRHGGLANAHRLPLVLTEEMGVEPVSINAEDAQLLEARKFQVIDIARAFGVPPHLIGETSASTSWGTGIESMGRAFAMYTLAQHLAVIEQELNRKLFRTSGRFVTFDRSVLMEADKDAQGKYFRAMLGGPGTGKGAMTVNEVRNAMNLPPMEGEDEIYTPPAKAVGDPQPKEPGAQA